MAETDEQELARINAEFTDAILRRQIYLQGYSKSLAKDVQDLLDKTEADVEQAIRQRLTKIAGNAGIDLGPDTTSRLKTLGASIAKIRGEVFGEATDQMTEQLTQLTVDEAEAAQNALDHATGSGDNEDPEAPAFDTVLPTAGKLASIVSTKPLEGKLMSQWMDDLSDDDQDRIMQAITIGLTRGDSIDDIVRRVIGSGGVNGADGVTQLTRNNLASIARTAVNTVTNAARSEFFQQNDDVFDQEQFVATLDSHTTDICAATDGTISPVGEGPQPPLHWGCRSIVVAMIGDKLGGKRNATGDDGPERVDANTTYQTFLERQSASFQDDVLGQTKGKLFRDGGMTLKSFVQRDGSSYTLDELRDKAPAAFRSAGIDEEE